MEERINHLLYLVINETNNGGAGAKTKLWLKYSSGLKGSDQIETIKIELRLRIIVLYHRVNQQKIYLYENQDLNIINTHWH